MRVPIQKLMQSLVVSLPLPLMAADPCLGFKWDTGPERALFATGATAITSAPTPDAAPTIVPGKLYALSLHPQADVRFAAAPTKKRLTDAASAGLVRFRLDEAGSYRIALSAGAWIDVIADGKLLTPADFSGAPGCVAPRKIVEYALPANLDLLLQLSAAPDPDIRVGVSQLR